MLEPLIVLTVLNCIFMFSSTVTTCALWWQYQSHRCCVRKKAAQQKCASKISKSSSVIRAAKKLRKSNAELTLVSKSSTSTGREQKNKISQKKRSKRSTRYLESAENHKKSEEKFSLPGGLESRNLEEKTKTSEASQTTNDAKSTVVMEFSTVQKVVQIVDNDSEVNSTRAPFKDIVIQKDKKYNHDVRQNFVSNLAATENS